MKLNKQIIFAPIRHWKLAHALGIASVPRVVGLAGMAAATMLVEFAAVAILPALLRSIQGGDVSQAAQFDFVSPLIARIGFEPGITGLIVLLLALLWLRQAAVTAEIVIIERTVQRAYRAVSGSLYEAWLRSAIGASGADAIGTWTNLMLRQTLLASQLLAIYTRLFRLLLAGAGYVIAAFAVNSFVTAVGLAYAAIMLFGLTFLLRRAKRISRMTIDLQNRLGDYLADSFLGRKQIKVFQMEPAELSRLQGQVSDLGATQVRMQMNSSLVPLSLTTAVCFLVLGLLAIPSPAKMFSLNEIVLYVVIIGRLLPTLQAVASRAQAIVVNGQSLERVYEARHRLISHQELTGGLSFAPRCAPLAFEAASFAYPGRGECLNDVSFSIVPGTVVALTGPSGTGKSTLIDMLPRLIDPVSGMVKLGGTDLRNFNIGAIRSCIALATQEPFLFAATIEQNIQVGRPDATREEVVAACEAAGAAEFISSLPNGLNTVIGQGGAGLSGGQKQRIALARVLVSDAQILLFDEPTSAVDPTTEIKIFEAIQSKVRRKCATAIIVTHRTGIVDRADAVVEIRNGEALVKRRPAKDAAVPNVGFGKTDAFSLAARLET